MATSAADIEDFVGGSLVTWLASCLERPERLVDYSSLCDGLLIHEVLTQIDPEPLYTLTPILIGQATSTITLTRIRNFDSIVKNIKALYEDELCQTIVRIPDVVILGSEPRSASGLDNLRLLLLLLLGCAVQCPNKEAFITRIKELPVDIQHDIVTCIKKVTDDQTIVITPESAQQDPENLLTHIRALIVQRDATLEQWTTSQISILQAQQQSPSGDDRPGDPQSPCSNTSSTHSRKASGVSQGGGGVESNHLAVELADWKARLRKLRQELEDKSEALVEYKEELEYSNTVMAKLRAENGELMAEARRAKAYRDELDALREHAERADRLEAEAQRYRERLADTEFYRQRVEELREDNKVLMDTREMLESQLTRARQRSENAPRLEAELLSRDQTINELILERDAARDKVQELVDENTRLQLVTREVTATQCLDTDSETEQTNSEENSLSEQLTNNAQARALKLELENRKLQTVIDNMKETSFHETADKILELEKEKKKLVIKCEQLTENCTRLSKQNFELENAFKSALDENSKIQESLDASRSSIDRLSNEIQAERLRSQEIERNMEALTKEKHCVQSLCDTIKTRADDLESTLSDTIKKMDSLSSSAANSQKFETLAKERGEKISSLEKENTSLQKEVAKLKISQEEKNVLIDQQSAINEQQIKEIAQITKDLENASLQLQKLTDLEPKIQELTSQAAVYVETISTLQKDLVNTKLHTEKLKSVFEKLGLNISEISESEHSIDTVVQKICGNSEVVKVVKEVLKDKGLVDNEDVLTQAEQVVSSVSAEWKQQCEQLCSEIEGLQGQNARLQVDISTLSSQVNSLSAQHTALQLANSQLVAEKEELIKQQELHATQHETLLLDQVTLRTLHETLNNEYEDLIRDRDTLKSSLRDVRVELRDSRELCNQHEKKILFLEQEREALKTESKSLGNLRAEHSKLKDDFRNLYTASERLKNDYRALQENSRGARAEVGRLHLETTSLRGELSSTQLEANKLRQRCEMLLTMTVQLDGDRRALMGHAAQLLGQYHALLKHALDGERSHHAEQRALADRLHALCRQKDRLEDKIMEHYRKLDSCTSAKKKSFGASFVRRVRKAGSDFINKVPGNRRSWQDDSRLSQSEFMLSQAGSGESGNNDSDNSAEDSLQRDSTLTRLENRDSFNEKQLSMTAASPVDPVVRRSRRDGAAGGANMSRRASLGSTTGSVLSLGSAGTRRTVYLTEQETDPPSTILPDNSTPTTKAPISGSHSEGGTLLVYNRISTVIGGGVEPKLPDVAAVSSALANQIPTRDAKSNEQINPCILPDAATSTPNKTKENAIWYEYGCV